MSITPVEPIGTYPTMVTDYPGAAGLTAAAGMSAGTGAGLGAGAGLDAGMLSIGTGVDSRGLSGFGDAAGTATPSFASQLADGLQQVQQLESNADQLAIDAATGALSDPARYMTASTEATLATELAVAVRNKAVDAFNEIMRMQA